MRFTPNAVVRLPIVPRQMDHIFAEAELVGVGFWVIHPVPMPDGPHPTRYQVSHKTSGLAFLNHWGASYERCRELLGRIDASGLDWSLPRGQESLSADHKALGKILREEFSESKPTEVAPV